MIYCDDGAPAIVDNWITANVVAFSGGGISLFATLSATILANSIVWGNSAPDGIAIHLDGEFHGYGFLAVGFSDLEGGPSAVSVGPCGYLHAGPGLIAADPLFMGTGCDDYRLLWNSPCRNTGENALSGSLTEDFEGDPRMALGTADMGADMGADEFWYHLYHVENVIPGGTIEINVADKPQLPVTLFLGAAVEEPPLWQGGIGSIPTEGILKYPAKVPSMWPPGKSYPFQALVGPWGGSLTRFTNFLLLTAE